MTGRLIPTIYVVIGTAIARATGSSFMLIVCGRSSRRC